MLLIKRARVPAAVLPASVANPAPDPIEPLVLCDIGVEGKRIASVTRSPDTARSGGTAAEGAVDLDGAVVFPGFVDAHVHLDKAHTWERAPNRSGRFPEALEVLAKDREHWTRADLMRRAGFALHCAWEHGTRVLRTHVDTWLPGAEVNHAAMHELREAWQGRITLQTVPLTGIANYSGPDGDAVADLAMKYGACALGGWSPMAETCPASSTGSWPWPGTGVSASTSTWTRMATRRRRCFAWSPRRLSATGSRTRLSAATAAAWPSRPEERQRSTIALVKEARIRVVSLPLCNLYLQDRRGDEFPQHATLERAHPCPRLP